MLCLGHRNSKLPAPLIHQKVVLILHFPIYRVWATPQSLLQTSMILPRCIDSGNGPRFHPWVAFYLLLSLPSLFVYQYSCFFYVSLPFFERILCSYFLPSTKNIWIFASKRFLLQLLFVVIQILG